LEIAMQDDRAPVINPLIPIMILVAVVFGVFLAVALSNREPPRCTDYSYKLSRLPFNKKEAICNRWQDMTMEIDQGIVSGTMVNCKCP
jgi:hypothetical protein